MTDTILDIRDASIQKHFPTIMMPKYGTLPPLEMHKTRLVIAREGIYIQTMKPWAALTKKVYALPKLLPYGPLEEKDHFLAVLEEKVMSIVREEMLPEAAKYAGKGKEWQGFVVFENGDFKYHSSKFKATCSSVKYDVPDNIVADVHSHHSMRPFWSGTDNADDAGGVKIAMVLGSYDPAKVPVFDMKLRYCIEGFFFDYEEPSTEEILEDLIQKEITTIRGLIMS